MPLDPPPAVEELCPRDSKQGFEVCFQALRCAYVSRSFLSLIGLFTGLFWHAYLRRDGERGADSEVFERAF